MSLFHTRFVTAAGFFIIIDIFLFKHYNNKKTQVRSI